MIVAIYKKETEELVCTLDIKGFNDTIVIHEDYDIKMDGKLPVEAEKPVEK